jgi:hypothetical protein
VLQIRGWEREFRPREDPAVFQQDPVIEGQAQLARQNGI